MKVKRIQVLIKDHGSDIVNLWLDGVSTPFPKAGENDPSVFSSPVQKGYGVEWARENFPGVPLFTIVGGVEREEV